jgi:hypothetical protein
MPSVMTDSDSSQPKRSKRSSANQGTFDFGEAEAPFAPVVIPPPSAATEKNKTVPVLPMTATPSPKQEENPSEKISVPLEPKVRASEPAVSHTLSVTIEPQEKRKTSMSTTPPTVSDYRKNVERQTREQKSFDSVLATVGYSLLAAIVLVAGLAGYGGYVIWQQVQNQASTVRQLDAKYQQETALLRESLVNKQTDIDKLNDLVKRQQESSNRLKAMMDETTAALRAERAQRARETADLQQRLRRLSN